MNELIKQVLQWGEDKGITGPNGKGTKRAQADKMMEEAKETFDAVTYHITSLSTNIKNGEVDKAELDEIKDGIGDTFVTLILLAEMHGFTTEECLQAAYDVISKRTGEMVGGQFVKSK